MSNLMYLARSGLSAGQSALNIIGNNLVNATTPGYNRRNIMLGENGGLSTSVGFYGYGAKVDGVQRSYDAFINTQVRGALSSYSNSTVRYQSLSGIDNLFADVTNNVSTTLSDVFEGLTGLQGKPDDGPGRTNVLAQFRTLANQFNTRGKALDEELKATPLTLKTPLTTSII
ncbi:flagellar basal body protein [Apirhabdus apintestini]|nr:flagellar basal body protein [Enterobacteriaceae bacterium CA-0114]